MPDKSREQMISEIVAIYQELRQHGVFPREINLKKSSDEQLETELEAVGDQLKQRKKWLEVEV